MLATEAGSETESQLRGPTILDIHFLPAAVAAFIVVGGVVGVDSRRLLWRREDVLEGLHAMLVADARVA